MASSGEQSQCSKGHWREVASLSEQHQRRFAQRSLATFSEQSQRVMIWWREVASFSEEMMSQVVCYVSENPFLKQHVRSANITSL
ncbi:hypothetical protein A2U01_0063576, partial [Trifolium medium]|nr:hypothetical protein [Trifolium medium]